MRRVLLIAGFVLAFTATNAQAAWTSSRANTPSTMAAATLAAPSALTSSIAFDCTTGSVSWSAASGAAGYAVQRTTNGGATWATIASTTGTGTAWADAANFGSSVTATYRVASRTTVGNWTSAFATGSAVTCTQADNLEVVNASGTDTLAWTAATNAAGYDVERRTNGGTWSVISTNKIPRSYVDSTQFATGATVDYRVRAVESSGVRGTYTDIATVDSWSNTTSLGLAVTRTITSESTTSYCANITVKNNNSKTVTWRTTLSLATYPLDGTVTSQSGVTTVSMVGTDWTIGGTASNKTLARRATASGSYCAARTFQTAAADVSVAVTSDWATGYCATATVTTNSTTPINWNITLTPSMGPAAYWPATVPAPSNAATVSFSPSAWVLKGVGWNDWVVSGTPRTFQWCADKSS